MVHVILYCVIVSQSNHDVAYVVIAQEPAVLLDGFMEGLGLPGTIRKQTTYLYRARIHINTHSEI